MSRNLFTLRSTRSNRRNKRAKNTRGFVERLEARQLLSHVDGFWWGTTAQHLPIAAEVLDDRVTSIEGEISHCGFHVPLEIVLDSPAPIDDGQLATQGFLTVDGFRIDYRIDGSFDTTNHAMGTAHASIDPPICPDFDTTWEVTKTGLLDLKDAGAGEWGRSRAGHWQAAGDHNDLWFTANLDRAGTYTFELGVINISAGGSIGLPEGYTHFRFDIFVSDGSGRHKRKLANDWLIAASDTQEQRRRLDLQLPAGQSRIWVEWENDKKSGNRDANVEVRTARLIGRDLLDLTGPSVVRLVPLDPPESQVTRVRVEFSEQIQLATFAGDDLTLTRDGTPVQLDHRVITRHLSGSKYLIAGLQHFTAADGEYRLTVDAAGVDDPAGNSGVGSLSLDWRQPRAGSLDLKGAGGGEWGRTRAGNWQALGDHHDLWFAVNLDRAGTYTFELGVINFNAGGSIGLPNGYTHFRFDVFVSDGSGRNKRKVADNWQIPASDTQEQLGRLNLQLPAGVSRIWVEWENDKKSGNRDANVEIRTVRLIGEGLPPAVVEPREEPPPTAPLDGTWSGTTGQGLPIGVEIENDAATHAWGEVSYCGFQESFELRPPSPVRVNNGHVVVRGSETLFGYRINYVIEGDFLSNNRATGTARASGAPSFCGGDFQTTWELVRENTLSGIVNAIPVSDDTRATPLPQVTVLDQPSDALPGDANGDGRFDSSDLVAVFQNGKYETGQPATWEEGDWNGDEVFDSADLVAAFRAGYYDPRSSALVDSIFSRETPWV